MLWIKKNILSFLTLVYMVCVLTFGIFYFLFLNLDIFSTFAKKTQQYTFITATSKVLLQFLDSDLLKPVRYNRVTLQVKKGESLYDSLLQQNVEVKDIVAITRVLEKQFNLRSIKSSWEIKAILVSSKNWEYNKIHKLYIPVNNKEEIVLESDNNYNYVAYKKRKSLSRYIMKREFRIDDSIYASAKRADVPNSITYLLFKIMSWDVDFQREIRAGDVINIVFECLYNQNDELVTCDELLYGNLQLTAREDIIFYKYKNEYYHENGESVIKALLKTPLDQVNLTHVSSPFGFRMHPILGYTILHKGTDFAAPIGSRIVASGDGVIVKKYRSSTYGNYIRIKHNEHLSSAYAHMKGFAKGMYVGKRVKQWETIGYLGSTGRVTGPHLHYEVLVNGGATNPITIKVPSNTHLVDEEKQAFELYKTTLNTMIVRIPNNSMVLTPYVRDLEGNIVNEEPATEILKNKSN